MGPPRQSHSHAELRSLRRGAWGRRGLTSTSISLGIWSAIAIAAVSCGSRSSTGEVSPSTGAPAHEQVPGAGDPAASATLGSTAETAGETSRAAPTALGAPHSAEATANDSGANGRGGDGADGDGDRGGGEDVRNVPPPLEMAFVGDVMFGRYIEKGFRPIPKPNFDVLAQVAPLLASDLTVANLETAMVYDRPKKSPYGTRMRFAGTPEDARRLVDAGIQVVSLANNHNYDLRLQGAIETPKVIAEAGLIGVGVSRMEPPVFRVDTVEKNGWRVGFVAATEIRNGPQRPNAPVLPFVEARQMAATLSPLIAEARPDHDLLIVVVHWGREYAEQPSRRHIRAARALLAAGADAVIGHHPHVLQAIERRGDGLIAYSLGNFLFDNTRPDQQMTGVLRLRFRAAGDCTDAAGRCGPAQRCRDAAWLDRAVFHPAFVVGSPTPHPEPATGWRMDKVQRRLIRLSRAKPFETAWRPDGADLAVDEPGCPTPEPATADSQPRATATDG